jgi:uncharacterized protein (TIGR02147 family)
MALRETRIFNYTDFRLFLKDAFQELKERDSKYSQRFVMNRIGVKSSGWLADMLSGRRILGRAQMLELAIILDLEPREELYFQTIVDYCQAKSETEKKRAYEKLLTFQELPKDIVDADRFEYFSKWYYSAIREYLLIEPFRGDYAKLARTIRPAIKTSEAKNTIELLERLGFIKKFAGGEYRPIVEYVKKQNTSGKNPNHNASSLYYFQYIKANMELGLQALEAIPKQERDVSGVTLTLSEESFALIKDDIKALRQKMIKLSEAENKKFWKELPKDNRKVYEAIFQLFPVSKTPSSSEAQQ